MEYRMDSPENPRCEIERDITARISAEDRLALVDLLDRTCFNTIGKFNIPATRYDRIGSAERMAHDPHLFCCRVISVVGDVSNTFPEPVTAMASDLGLDALCEEWRRRLRDSGAIDYEDRVRNAQMHDYFRKRQEAN